MYDTGDFNAKCPKRRSDCNEHCEDCNRDVMVKNSVEMFLRIARLNFDKPFELGVLGHKVMYRRGEVIIERNADSQRILIWSGGTTDLPDNEATDIQIYGILKAACVVLTRKYAPFKSLIGPCRSLVPRLVELDLVKTLISSVNEKQIQHSFGQGSESLHDYVSKIVPIENIEDCFKSLSNEGCMTKDMKETSNRLREAAHINHCNADMVRKVFSIPAKIMLYVSNLRSENEKLKSTKAKHDNDKLQSSNEWVRFETDSIRDKYQAYTWDFDGELAAVEFISDMSKAVDSFTESENYICTFTEIFKRLAEETGLSDAVRGYRAIRRRYKKADE